MGERSLGRSGAGKMARDRRRRNLGGRRRFLRARARAARRESGEKEENRPRNPLGAGFMRPPRGHRTLFMWHRTRPVTTGLMRREDCILALHRTMGTGRWL